MTLLCSFATPLSAEQFGLFSYRVIEDAIEISDYPEDAVGEVDIPAEIDGKPVTSIGDSAFARCGGITSVEIPSSVTSIGHSAFLRCGGLNSVTIPGSVTSIGLGTFYLCGQLTDVTISPGVTSIGSRAFESCFRLSSITLPPSIVSISSSAFDDCLDLRSIDVESENLDYASVEGVLLDAARSTLVRCPEGKSGFYSIPKGVATIGDRAFSACGSLTNVDFPASITNIGGRAFEGCIGLTSVAIPKGVTDIGGSAFSGCTRLVSVVFEGGVTSIGGSAFSNCRALTNFAIQRVTAIGSSAFSGCDRLTSVTIGGDATGVTTIGDSAFQDCGALVSFAVNRGSLSVGSSAFSCCRSLRSVTFPDTVTSIGFEAFLYCTSLTGITFPNTIRRIESGAFEGCGGLSEAVFRGDAPGTLAPYVFARTAPGFTIHYRGGATGFTSPRWYGYSATMIDEAVYPAASWLMQNHLSYDTDLHQYLNEDGVSLLLAYALNLDPDRNLQSSLPEPVLTPDALTLTFHAASPGISYSVETSTDLRNWIASGVTLSGIGANNRLTASVSRSVPSRYLRLVVED